ncbi:hypothetical protein Tco_0340879 [Tanacetum coccineum]|uniref:Uncharacterized protein n=1 Tax=Tanacetum coccineum TaxID=301880 RepID=A0ABQ5H1D5_9ASTR
MEGKSHLPVIRSELVVFGGGNCMKVVWKCTQELQNLIKELGYRNAIDVEDVLTHPEENVVAQLLTDEEIIESVIGIIKMKSNGEDDESLQWNPIRERSY